MRLSSCFTSWLRPTLKHLEVKIYVNGKELEITSFDAHRLEILCKAITALWKLDSGSPYWFETDVVEYRKCFSPKRTAVELSCFTEDRYNPGASVLCGIPVRYRKRMLDKRHPIDPARFSTINWPAGMEVRFVCLDR